MRTLRSSRNASRQNRTEPEIIVLLDTVILDTASPHLKLYEPIWPHMRLCTCLRVGFHVGTTCIRHNFVALCRPRYTVPRPCHSLRKPHAWRRERYCACALPISKTGAI